MSTMYFHTQEERETRARNTAQGYRDTAALFPAVRKTLLQFDGKCYNKRFLEALHESANKHVCAEKRTISGGAEVVDIYFYTPINGTQTLCRIPLDNKRIQAADAITDASDRRAGMLQKAAEIERTLPEIERIKEQLAQLKKQAAAIANAVPYELQDIFDIKRIY